MPELRLTEEQFEWLEAMSSEGRQLMVDTIGLVVDDVLAGQPVQHPDVYDRRWLDGERPICGLRWNGDQA